MGGVGLNLNFPSRQLFVDFLQVHLGYYQLYLLSYCLQKYVSAQQNGNIDEMAHWKSVMEMPLEDLLDPKLSIHLEREIGLILVEIEKTGSWTEFLEALKDYAGPVAEFYRSYKKVIMAFIARGKHGAETQLRKESERQLRQEALDELRQSAQIAKDIESITDPSLRETMTSRFLKAACDFDESYRRSKASLESDREYYSLPRPVDLESSEGSKEKKL